VQEHQSEAFDGKQQKLLTSQNRKKKDRG